MPEIDEEEAEEMLAEDRRHIKETLRFKLPPVHTTDDPSRPLGFGATNVEVGTVDLDVLVDWRLQHQSHHAAVGVRTRFGAEQFAREEATGVSMRRQIIRRFHEVLKQEQDRGQCTGTNRDIHWRAPAPGARDGEVNGLPAAALDNGNSANAARAASAVASNVGEVF